MVDARGTRGTRSPKRPCHASTFERTLFALRLKLSLADRDATHGSVFDGSMFDEQRVVLEGISGRLTSKSSGNDAGNILVSI